jgi:NADPH:quinone reductase
MNTGTMKAVQMNRFGGAEVLEIVETSRPTPGPGHVLVRVHAAGVNFSETLIRENRYAVRPDLPAILGNEVAGKIESFGEGVEGVAVGARVAAPLFAAGSFFGGYAEFAVIDARFVVLLPAELSFESATALMVQGLTALYLVKQASPRGKTVLVNAAAGGVGSLLVQLAKRAGAKAVIAAASSIDKLNFARSLGADAVINYTTPDWIKPVRAASGGAGPDIIYESVGGEVTKACLEALAPLGQLVIYGALNIQSIQLGVPELLGLIFKNQSVTGFALAPLLTPENLKSGLAELFDLVVSGQLRVEIGGTFPLARATEAHRALEARRTTGKLVLLP